jgi:hypothetical protein
MGKSFKVTIPAGSLLESELIGKEGKQRQQRLYFLAELGAEQLKREPISVVKNDVVKREMETKKEFKNRGVVTFPVEDLLSM